MCVSVCVCVSSMLLDMSAHISYIKMSRLARKTIEQSASVFYVRVRVCVTQCSKIIYEVSRDFCGLFLYCSYPLDL